jgi:hypothetical protein
VGKPTGSFFGVLRRMVADELVDASTGTPTRGTRYSLSRDVRELLLAMDRQAAAIPAVRAQQQLLLVERPDDMVGVQRVLAQESVSGLIAWAAETQGGWLLAVEAESTYPLTALAMALQHVGVTSRPLRIDDVLSGVELRDRAMWALEDAVRAAAVDNGSGT